MMDNAQIHKTMRNEMLKARDREPDAMDADQRRLALSLLALLKRRYPADWRRLVAEIDRPKAA